MATIYADPRFEPRHPFRTFVLVTLLAVATFVAALYLAAHYTQPPT